MIKYIFICCLFLAFLSVGCNLSKSNWNKKSYLGEYIYSDGLMSVKLFLKDSIYIFEHEGPGMFKQCSEGNYEINGRNLVLTSIYRGSFSEIKPVSWKSFKGAEMKIKRNIIFYKGYRLIKKN